MSAITRTSQELSSTPMSLIGQKKDPFSREGVRKYGDFSNRTLISICYKMGTEQPDSHFDDILWPETWKDRVKISRGKQKREREQIFFFFFLNLNSEL